MFKDIVWGGEVLKKALSQAGADEAVMWKVILLEGHPLMPRGVKQKLSDLATRGADVSVRGGGTARACIR